MRTSVRISSMTSVMFKSVRKYSVELNQIDANGGSRGLRMHPLMKSAESVRCSSCKSRR